MKEHKTFPSPNGAIGVHMKEVEILQNPIKVYMEKGESPNFYTFQTIMRLRKFWI